MLEQIKSRGGLRINEKGYTETDISIEEIQWMVDTIERLESEKTAYRNEWEILKEENERYAKALGFYSLRSNYNYSPIDDNIPEVNKDGGKIARKVLKC